LDAELAHRNASTYKEQNNTEKGGYIHALSGIRTHDPGVRTVQDQVMTMSTLIYVSETWTVTQKGKNQIQTSEMKILRYVRLG